MSAVRADPVSPAGRPTIALLIPALTAGGAERQLVELASNLDARRWRVLVVTVQALLVSQDARTPTVFAGLLAGYVLRL